jgi:hypothetical protein
MVRLGSEAAAAALRQPHTRMFAITGKPMKNWVLVDPAGVKTAAALKKWVGLGVSFAGSLPPK